MLITATVPNVTVNACITASVCYSKCCNTKNTKSYWCKKPKIVRSQIPDGCIVGQFLLAISPVLAMMINLTQPKTTFIVLYTNVLEKND